MEDVCQWKTQNTRVSGPDLSHGEKPPHILKLLEGGRSQSGEECGWAVEFI